jgi:sugar/nucleoside kinase (ribokinase family)
MNLQFDVLGLGNAIVDIIAQADDDFLAREKLQKGSMALIDEARAESLYRVMGPLTTISGGSAANTIAGVAALGCKAAFTGKVRNDGLGESFAHDIKSLGVEFRTSPASEGPATARCFVIVTPDGERTMNTFLGACQRLSSADLDQDLVKASKVTYLEGYLWDPPEAKDAFREAVKIAHSAERLVAFTLSDAFCVDRYRAEFLDLVATRSIDVLFANEHELKSLYETSDLQSAVSALRGQGVLGVVTRSEQGALIIQDSGATSYPAFPVDRVVDTTGAGDLFAAGFLAGMTKQLELGDCARLGAMAAAEIIQHIGARPQRNLLDMARENGIEI